MNINFHILKASGRLTPYIENINKICIETKEKVIAKLPFLDNVDVVVVDSPYYTISEIGIGGYARSQNFIEVSLNPDFPNFQQAVNQHLSGQLSHEFHHAIRMQTIGYGETLLEAMATEGLADHFAYEIIGTKYFHPWNKALTSKQIKTLLKRATEEYHNKTFNHSAWFFGSEEKRIPRWTAYTLGFNLVENYLKTHPTMKASTLYKTKAEEFLL